MPKRQSLLAHAHSLAVDDETIRREIATGRQKWGRVWCPHTATAAHFRERLASDDWVIVATAHPAKFESIVEPLIGERLEVPPQLRELLERPNRLEEIEADLDQFISRM